MVCKKDVVTWFKSLKSYKRVDVMCSLLQLCVPFELRFLGTCLEDLAKRDFQDLRQTEKEANNLSEFNSPEVQCISNHETRTKLALYVSLLHSYNDACSNRIYKILTKDDINSVLKLAMTDDNVLEELLSIYTLALNHPSFSFDQKIALDKIFSKLQEEELRLCDQNAMKNKQNYSPHQNIQDAIHEKAQPTPIQSYQTCISLEDQAHQQCYGVTNPAAPCAPPLPQPHIQPKPAYITYGEPFVGEERRGWGGGNGGTLVGGGDSSPLVSRTNSPCQSPSRPASPPRARPTQHSPPTPRAAPPHPLRETINKEMPAYFNSLHNYTVEQLSRMNDEELRELGLPPNAIAQLRAILTKQQMPTTNGIPPHPHPPHALVDLRKKPEMLVRSMEGVYPGPVCLSAAPSCYSCFTLGPRAPKYPVTAAPPPLYPATIENLRALRIDQESNSSASDTASDHSPPDTPGPEGAPPPQRRQPPLQPRGRGHQPVPPQHGVVYRRREGGLSNGCDERKVYSGGVENPGYFSAGTGWPGHPYMRPAAYPTPPFPFVRPPPQAYPFQPNGEMVYPYPAYPPPPYPPQAQQIPPKLSCYNCGSPSHAPLDCPESTMEEITKHGQYRIDYTKQQQGSSPSDQTDK